MEIRYDADGFGYRHEVRARRATPRVVFGRTRWDGPMPGGAINVREVRFDGAVVGDLYGVDAVAGNEHRPTAYRLYLQGHDPQTVDRLESAREHVLYALDPASRT